MGNGIFVWIGKKCSKKEKESSMDIANKFLLEKKYPTWTQVLNYSLISYYHSIAKKNDVIQVNRVVDGGEPTLFKQYFSSWKEASLTPQHTPVAKNNRISGTTYIFYLPLVQIN